MPATIRRIATIFNAVIVTSYRAQSEQKRSIGPASEDAGPISSSARAHHEGGGERERHCEKHQAERTERRNFFDDGDGDGGAVVRRQRLRLVRRNRRRILHRSSHARRS